MLLTAYKVTFRHLLCVICPVKVFDVISLLEAYRDLLLCPLSVSHFVVEDDFRDRRISVIRDPPADVDRRRRRLHDVHVGGFGRL